MGLAIWLGLVGGANGGDVLAVEWPECVSDIECATHSVVSVLPILPPSKSRNEEPEGSGVVIKSGRTIATASHVIGSATEVLIRTVSGQIIRAEILLRDKGTDIALLKIQQELKPIAYGIAPRIGQTTCAIGNSFGLGVSMACGTVSATQLSGTGFNAIEDFVQTDAAVNPGMSGGALINTKGQLIGMLSAIFTKKSDSNIGVNFAVSTKLLNQVVTDFLLDGKLTRQAPGLAIRPSLKAGETGIIGALVVRVVNGSSESKAGVKTGDIILYANGRRIKRAGSYRAALALLGNDNRMILDVLRNGERKSIVVKFD